MKRVVTGVNEHGPSYVVSSDELPISDFQTIWDYEPGQVPDSISAIDPGPRSFPVATSMTRHSVFGRAWPTDPFGTSIAQSDVRCVQGLASVMPYP
jgi:hypothetical protein